MQQRGRDVHFMRFLHSRSHFLGPARLFVFALLVLIGLLVPAQQVHRWGCEISGAVTHGGRSRGGLLAVHPNPSRRLGPAEMLHRKQDRHPIKLHEGLGCMPRLQSDLLDLPASVVPAGSCLPHKHGVTAGMSSLRMAGVHRAEAGDQLSLIISIFAIRIGKGNCASSLLLVTSALPFIGSFDCAHQLSSRSRLAQRQSGSFPPIL